MSDADSNMFADCTVRFRLQQGECFSINPDLYLDFDKEGTPLENLVRADFQLTSEILSHGATDHIYVRSLVELRKFLTDINTMDAGAMFEFMSEERMVSLTFTRQDSTLRISGQIPNEGYPAMMYSDFESRLEKEFEIQFSFYCNFPLINVSEVVEQITRVLRIIDYPE